MGIGLRSIIFLSIAGAGTLTGIAVASRNDFNGEKIWKKTKDCIVKLSKSSTKIIHSCKDKSVEENVDSKKKNNEVKQINVTLEDNEIIVANFSQDSNDNQNQEEKIFKLPSLNQTYQHTTFVSYLFFIDESLDNSKLRKTLEELLKKYEILSGKLIRNKKSDLLEIKLCNNGVYFSIAKYDNTMSDVLPTIKGVSLAPNLADLYGQNFSIEQCIKSSNPMIQIRITHFSDEKTCISIRTPNVIADITSIKKFVQDWSLLYRDEQLSETTKTIFDSEWINNYVKSNNLENMKYSDNYQPLALANVKFFDWIKLAFNTFWEWIVGGGFQTRAFYISEKQLEELRYQVISDAKLVSENTESENEGNKSKTSPTSNEKSNTNVKVKTETNTNSNIDTEKTPDTEANINNNEEADINSSSPATITTTEITVETETLSESNNKANTKINTNESTDNSINWISAKDVLVAHIWKKISTLPRNISYSNRVFKNCNLRMYTDKSINNIFGNMTISAVSQLTYITLLSSLYFLSKRIHTSMSNLPIQLPNLLNWINSQKEEELPLIKVPVNLVGKQTDILIDDADIDTTEIKFSKENGKGNVIWLYQESKPSIPNIVTIVKTSKITETENIKGYYIYVTLSRIDMNSLIKHRGL